MPFAKKKEKKAKAADSISDRERALNEQIAALESEIKKLDSQLQHSTAPKLRSTVLPDGATITRKSAGVNDRGPADAGAASAQRKSEPPPAPEPVFEEVKGFRAFSDTTAPDQFNEHGVRKYDLPALLNRLRGWFNRPAPSNPRLVTYLAAGGVQGLRPLRYEKRIARRRFIVLVVALLLILLGIFAHFLRNR
jgi:hypothetical protein